MKSIAELGHLLADELSESITRYKQGLTSGTLNFIFGDTSAILTAILDQKIKRFKSWDDVNWIDDCILKKINVYESKLSFWGVIIWGKLGNTEQYTSPLYSEVHFSEDKNILYILFKFMDKYKNSSTYEEFSKDRDQWDVNFYSNKEWNPEERSWLYIIKHSFNTSF